MSEIVKDQWSRSASEICEEFYLPELFGEWANMVAEVGGVQPGQRILDVACVSGVVARESRLGLAKRCHS